MTPRADPQAMTDAERERRRALGEVYALIRLFLARRRAAQAAQATINTKTTEAEHVEAAI